MPDTHDLGAYRSQGLADILDRVLDKGLVIAGDITINLANVELLTIRIRLLVCSIDKAESIGMNWWRTDPHYAAPLAAPRDVAQLTDRLDTIAARLDALETGRTSPIPSQTPRES